MVEYTRDKILPEDLIQKTNLQQHNFMITAINDIDGRQADIEDITNVNIDDIAALKTGVVTLSNEKLDKADIDADLHFGDISVTRDGTAVLMSLDVFNPTTGIVTPISFTIPGATSALAGSMDASSVAWIADAENRISALEGLSDVKAVSGLSSEPTQSQLNYAWVAATSKQAETGDIIQDVNNAKLWVFVTDTWILYGTLVVVPMATTTSIGGIKDTALNAVGNRWYCHVEADGRVALIGGDVLSTLIDTTVPALQSAVSGCVKKTGDTMTGRLCANGGIEVASGVDVVNRFRRTDVTFNNPWTLPRREIVYDKDNNIIFETQYAITNTDPRGSNSRIIMNATTYNVDKSIVTTANFTLWAFANGDRFASCNMRPNPGIDDIITRGYLDSRLTTKQDTLVFDSTPILNSTKPVTSGGIYNNLLSKADKSELTAGLALKADVPEWTYGSGTLTTNAGTCGYNYAYSVIGNVVTMRFTVGSSVDNQFTVPLPVSVSSAGVQCIGIADDARFWVDYGGTATSSINVNRSQTTVQERSFHMLVIGQPSG